MMDVADGILKEHPWVYTPVALLMLAVVAAIAYFIVKKIIIRLVMRILDRTSIGRDEEIRRFRFVERLANVTPAFVISIGIMLVPDLPQPVVTVVRNVSQAFIVLMLAMAIGSALSIADTIYHRRPQAKRKPIRGYVQVVKLAVYLVAAVLIVAELIDRSPIILLSGVGAMAAVLILVFQDTLLSFVASIQISSTDMLRVGDWIEMPSLNADGDVIEVALHTVRVQNWDKTITTIPTRKLVSDSFKNWRGMQESGGRRIKRAIFLDQTSIRFLTAEEVDRLGRFRHLEDYLSRKQEEISTWNKQLGERGRFDANRRRLTNAGTFRAYVDAYLKAHPGIHKGMTLLVRQLQPQPDGLPLEIYCFTNTTAWGSYEAIQADIFDHLLALLPEFGLAVFQSPGGADVRALAQVVSESRPPALPAAG